MDHVVLTTLQSGFISADSTVNQLVDIYNSFCKAIDEGKEVRAIFCDISKAFDQVSHKGLLYKLQTVGITGHLLQWFTDYLNSRKQRVVLPGVFSHWTDLKAGVPQGSILGPLLFLIYINDIVRNINSSIRLFADDTSLYIIVENPIQAATLLNVDLSQIYTWASNWLVTFNPSKTEGCHRINVMRKLKFQLNRKTLQIIFFHLSDRYLNMLMSYGITIRNMRQMN